MNHILFAMIVADKRYTGLICLRLAGCPSSLSGSSGSFSSPNYPNTYAHHENCQWGITVPSGYTVRVEFQAFQTEGGYDFLRIYDGQSNSGSLLRELDGSHSGVVVISSGRHMWFHFESDHSNVYPGFAATFMAIGPCK